MAGRVNPNARGVVPAGNKPIKNNELSKQPFATNEMQFEHIPFVSDEELNKQIPK